jgi:hypothetical protein
MGSKGLWNANTMQLQTEVVEHERDIVEVKKQAKTLMKVATEFSLVQLSPQI